MNLYGLVISAGISFLFLVLVFRPLEALFPGQAGTAFLSSGLVYQPLFLPRPVPALERAGLLGAIAFQLLARRRRVG